MNYFKLLGVSPSATPEHIKKSFHKMAKKFHPDLNPDGIEIFKYINQAYETLIDPKKRIEYQSILEKRSIADKLSDRVFEFLGFTDKPKRGNDIKLKVSVSLKEGIFGSKKRIDYKRRVICEECEGSGLDIESKISECDRCFQGRVKTKFGKIPCPRCLGRGFIILNPCKRCRGDGYHLRLETIYIDVPVGVGDREIIKLKKLGNAGINGGDYADLYVEFRLNTGNFKKIGKDLILKIKLEKPIDSYESLNIKLPTDEKISIKLPQEKPPLRLKIREAGYVDKDFTRGNLFIDII